jgi:hypothetical protein
VRDGEGDPRGRGRGRGFRDQEPRFRDREPRFRATLLAFRDREPRFPATRLGFRDREPRFHTALLRFRDRELRFRETLLRFRDREPSFHTALLRFHDREPRFRETLLRFRDREPKFRAALLAFRDREPSFRATLLAFRDREPRFRETLLRFRDREPSLRETLPRVRVLEPSFHDREPQVPVRDTLPSVRDTHGPAHPLNSPLFSSSPPGTLPARPPCMRLPLLFLALLSLVSLLLAACASRAGPLSSSLPCPPDAAAGTCTPFGASGGSAPQLTFAIVGDTRPANVDDTAGYPTATIDAIFTAIAASSPQPSFVIATGDYQFASTHGTESAPQLDLYLQARAKFPGVLLPAMGNHECTGYTTSNCGLGNTDGFPPNYTTFLERVLWPIHETLPYYASTFDASDGSWSSKIVVIAANAWDGAQASWLDTALSTPTTYTFVVRHEPVEASTAPGTTPSEAIVKQHPLTLEICGHTHTYSRRENRVVFGNGGAPLTGDKSYGYGLVQQQADGTLTVDAIDSLTGQPDPAFHFAVNPDGSPAG